MMCSVASKFQKAALIQQRVRQQGPFAEEDDSLRTKASSGRAGYCNLHNLSSSAQLAFAFHFSAMLNSSGADQPFETVSKIAPLESSALPNVDAENYYFLGFVPIDYSIEAQVICDDDDVEES